MWGRGVLNKAPKQVARDLDLPPPAPGCAGFADCTWEGKGPSKRGHASDSRGAPLVNQPAALLSENHLKNNNALHVRTLLRHLNFNSPVL